MPGGKATQVPPVRISIRVATIGLALVLLLLTGFAVTVAVTNSNGTDRASRAAAEADLYEKASEALLVQEESAEEVVAEGPESRSEYTMAHLATGAALQELTQLPPDSHGAEEGETLQSQHTQYGAAVEAMFVVALENPDRAEAYEEANVDPHFDPLAAALAEHVKARNEEARAALDSINSTQHLLAIATPSVFGVALVLLTMFMVMLSRSRRLVGAQADENRYQSLHDVLTGLPNRTLLHRRGTECIEQSAVTGTPVGLMLLDLDRFKEINDTLGHHHGDLVLQAVSERLLHAVRSSDIVTRLGGDEFAILLPQVEDTASAFAVAAHVQEALRTSIDAAGVLLDVDISMGLAISGVHGNDIETLLQHADIAMYRAKDHDLGVAIYDEELNEHNREQLGLLGDLRRAMDNDELVLHFQPKVALPGGQFCGAEALLRWEHPTRGLIPPGMFIPPAERTALIRPLTSWVLNAALAECKRWQDEGQPLQLAVNVSARNLLEASFGDDVMGLLARWDLPPSCLALEVTESAMMVDPARAETILWRFAEMGISLSIDDFGAGYTSLGHLRNLPVHELKIDQSLVRQMATSAADTLIIKAVIELAHSLGLRTVAEGVEDAGTLDRLTVMGCDVAQGFHLARPMPAAALRLLSHGALLPETMSPQEGLGAVNLPQALPE
jgi:diguanylate cyclase (GGDEF)-like protein